MWTACRVDAVASMLLHLDYGRAVRTVGTRISSAAMKNLEAVEFFKHLNSVLLGATREQ